MRHPRATRREFLRSAAQAGAVLAIPTILPATVLGKNGAVPPSEKIVVGGIGIQHRGMHDLQWIMGQPDVQFVAICDLQKKQRLAVKSVVDNHYGSTDCAMYPEMRSFLAERTDIDAVLIAVPYHWAAPIATMAMRAGKDVYCEMPLTLTVDEGKKLTVVQKKTGRVLQTGSQQRSDRNFRLACELVRNGRIGKIKEVDVWLPSGRREGPFKKADVPATLNWDMWQGPTPSVDYVPERTHVTFRYWWDYSGGTMTDWGAHHNDIALWGLGRERSGPVKVRGNSLKEMIKGGFSAASVS